MFFKNRSFVRKPLPNNVPKIGDVVPPINKPSLTKRPDKPVTSRRDKPNPTTTCSHDYELIPHACVSSSKQITVVAYCRHCMNVEVRVSPYDHL